MTQPIDPDPATQDPATQDTAAASGDYFAHPTAVIDEPASIGRGTNIWHFSHIMKGARIGEECNLGQNVFVASGVEIGRGCKIQNNVSLYEGVILDDYVFCGPSMVFTNVKNPRSEIVRRGEYLPTRVGRGVTFGANCTVVCGVTLGDYAFVAAGAVVAADVPPHALVAGVPARRIGWTGRAGLRLEPEPGRPGVFTCPQTGEKYLEEDGRTLKPITDDAAIDASALGVEASACISSPSGEAADGPPEAPPVPLLDLAAQHATIKAEIAAAVGRVVESQYFILGPEVKAFEQEAAAYVGAPHAIACASGSDALLLALMALELEPGDEVITTPYSFFATVGSIVRLGLRPVFCDIDPLTYNLDPQRLKGLVTARTRAILPVHLFGQCADMEPILEIAARHKLAVIEDAAQAIGATQKGRSAGTIGTMGCFSFYPSKNLGGAGDGGLVTTGDGALAERLALLHVHGAKKKYIHDYVGMNSRLDALQAAILRVKLPHVEGWSAARAANAARYRRLFGEAGLTQDEGSQPWPGQVILPAAPATEPASRHVYNQFVIRVEAAQRDALQAHLKNNRIGSEVYYPLGLHLQPCLAHLGWREGDCPETERASRQTLALPIYPELTENQQHRVVETIGSFLRHA